MHTVLVSLLLATQPLLADNPPVTTFGRGQLVSLNASSRNEWEPSIGSDGKGGVFLSWKDGPSGSSFIRYAYSRDYGETWSQDRLVPSLKYKYQSDPVIVVGGDGRVTLSWIAYSNQSETAVLYCVSKDGGATWSEPTKMCAPSREGAKDFFDRQWHVVNGDQVVMTYHVQNRIYAVRSKDGGTTVEGVSNPDGKTGGAISAVVARTPDGAIHTTWLQFRTAPTIRYAKSTDGGVTWEKPKDIMTMKSLNFRGRAQCFSTIGGDSVGNVYVSWVEGKGRDGEKDPAGGVYLIRSEDGGATWSQPLKITDTPDGADGHKIQPWMFVDAQDRVHLSWLEQLNGHWYVRYAVSADRGASFSKTVPVSSPHAIKQPYQSDFIGVTADDRYVYIAAPIPIGGTYLVHVFRAPVSGMAAPPVVKRQ